MFATRDYIIMYFRMQTGNANLDSMIYSMLLPMLCTLLYTFKRHIEKHASTLIFRLCNRHTTLVVMNKTSNDEVNYNYNALTWYITNDVTMLRNISSIDAFNTTDSDGGEDDKLVISDNSCVTTTFKNATIKCSSEFRKGTAKKEDVYLFRLTSQKRDMQLLLDFQKHVLKTWRAHMRTVQWSQLIWTVKSSSWMPTASYNNRTWDNVILKADVKQMLREDLDTFCKSEDWYNRLGANYTRGYLLYGPPGTGKTTAVKCMSNSAKVDMYILSLSSVKTDEDLMQLFGTLPPRCMLVIEDIDCAGTFVLDRTLTHVPRTDNKSSHCTLSCLLNMLDGIISGHGRIVVMTSNHPEQLDPALIRPGRCDLKVQLTNCSREQINDMFQLYFKTDIPPEVLASIPEDQISPAQVSSLCMAHHDDPKKAFRLLKKIKIS